MSLRQNVISIIRERLLNQWQEGAVFGSKEEHHRWIFGAPGENEGFLRNPVSALECGIASSGLAQLPHLGVRMSLEENSELKRLIENFVLGKAPVPALPSGPQNEGIAFDHEEGHICDWWTEICDWY